MSESQQQNTNKEWLLNVQACPMDASVSWDPNQDTKAERIEWYEYYNLLPLSIRWGLAADEIIKQILVLAKKHGVFDEHRVGEISRIVREYFFKPPTEQQLVERIKDKFELPVEQIEPLIRGIKNIISEVIRVGNESVDEVTERIPIIPALKKFPELRNQIITEGSVILFETKEMVTGSVGNWIDDYIQRKGAQAHDNIQRSDYIFNSENGQRLEAEDRKKLGFVFESYDNDVSLEINTEAQEILFSAGFEPEKKAEPKVEIKEPQISQQQQSPNRDYFGKIVEKDDKQESQEIPNEIKSQQKPSEIVGPPQPQVDVVPEKDALLKNWKDQNLQSMNGGVAVPGDGKENNIQKRQEIPNESMPYEKSQEIGWFGESTGIDEVDNRRKKQQQADLSNNENTEETKKEVQYGRPRAVTRNYREVEKSPKQSSKHVINLKEVV